MVARIRIVALGFAIWTLLFCLASCDMSPGVRRLDEAVMYDGPNFRLKLVRYYENLPLHYSGEIFSVQCSSAGTATSPGHSRQDPGWLVLGSGGAIGSKSAAELVERERANYRVMDDRTLVWTSRGLHVSFDACGTFRHWDPVSLPADLIADFDKPDYCAPKGTVDCSNLVFEGERAPIYEDVGTTPDGMISFLVKSKAFKGGAFRVQSTDQGRTWTYIAQ